MTPEQREVKIAQARKHIADFERDLGRFPERSSFDNSDTATWLIGVLASQLNEAYVVMTDLALDEVESVIPSYRGG